MRNNKIISAIIAFVTAVVLAVGVCCLGFASRGNDGKWFGGFKDLSSWHWSDKSGENKPVTPDGDKDNPDKPDEPNTPDNPDKPDDTYGGNSATSGNSLIKESENYGISLLSEVIPRESFEANGISTYADSAYTLTAQYSPAGATDLWEWTVTGNEDEGITLTPAGMSATVTCNKAFGVQKVITIASKSNSAVKATCTVDYYKRFQGVSLSAPATITLNKGTTEVTAELVPEFGIGTILDTTVSMTEISIKSTVSGGGYASTDGDMRADATAIVEGSQGTGTVSLLMSATAPSSFYNKIQGADCGELYEAYYKWFISRCTSLDIDHFEISVGWYAMRGNSTFDSGFVTAQGKFDVSGLRINVEDVNLSDTNIVF